MVRQQTLTLSFVGSSPTRSAKFRSSYTVGAEECRSGVIPWITNVCRQTTESTVHLCDGVTATATLRKMEKTDIVSVKSDKQTAVKCPIL